MDCRHLICYAQDTEFYWKDDSKLLDEIIRSINDCTTTLIGREFSKVSLTGKN